MQISLLTKEKRVLLKRLQPTSKDHSVTVSKDIDDRKKCFTLSSDDVSSTIPLKEIKSEAELFSATSHVVGISPIGYSLFHFMCEV